MSHEWKALANAIFRYRVDPNLSRGGLECAKCKNPYMWIKYKEDTGVDGSLERFAVYVMMCPECGHVELDGIGTYDLTEVGWRLEPVIENIKRYFEKTTEMYSHVIAE